jgi:putative peptidoglycan lipid II flippase
VLLRGTAIVSVLTLLSRLLGFVRDLLVARLLGASLFADAFFVAFRIPNLLRSFVAEGALTSAFTPVFSQALTRGKEHANDSFKRIAGFLIAITSLITAAIILFAVPLVDLLAPGYRAEPGKFELCVKLTRIMAPYIICVSLIAMLNAALNTLKVFGASAWAQVIMNVTLIIGALIAIPYAPETATTILAISVLIGGLVQIFSQIPACRRSALPLTPSFAVASREVKEVTRLMIPATLGASIYQITIFIATLLASLLPSGSVSWLFYADRVAQFPIGIFSIALASVLLPALSTASANSDQDSFNRGISNSLRYTSFCVIPMAAGIWALATPITQLLFERGAFTAESTIKTSQALRALAWGLWASSCYSMLVRAFIARRDTITPSLIGLAALIINICASLLLMGPITNTPQATRLVSALAAIQSSLTTTFSALTDNLGHIGLALASSISAFASLILVIILFTRSIGSFPWDTFVNSTIRSTLAALAMIAAINLISANTLSPLAKCLIAIPAGALSYLLATTLLRSRELSESLTLVRDKLRPRPQSLVPKD